MKFTVLGSHTPSQRKIPTIHHKRRSGARVTGRPGLAGNARFALKYTPKGYM
jgi:hypothetical protein